MTKTSGDNMTATEVADYLGVSLSMVYKLVDEKKLPHAKIGRRKVFNRLAIQSYKEKNSVQVEIVETGHQVVAH